MGMVGQVQFMNYCGSGDLGTPADTKAMGDGLAWANVQFDPPWLTSSDNATGNGTAGTNATGRRLLDDDDEPPPAEAAPVVGCQLGKRPCATNKYQGTLFYNVLFLVAVAVLHYALIELILQVPGSP
jgi:hypothetical protein